jgi:hypothetical protein
MAHHNMLTKARVVVPRTVTRRWRTLPDFIGLGAMKSGSTSLHQWITDQPGVLAARMKEVHFFDVHYELGLPWYRSHFPLSTTMGGRSRRRLLTGESTPYYLFDPRVPSRISATVPDAKLIVVVRNPVERAHSHYAHEIAKGREHLPFSAALDAEPDRLLGEEERLTGDERYQSQSHRHCSYMARGCYAVQLERWFQVFPRKQLMVVCAEELFDQPRLILESLSQFLGLIESDPQSFPRRNSRSYGALDPSMRARLDEYFAPHNERLFQLLGRELPW